MKKQKKKLEQTDDKKQKLLLGKKITELENASQELKIEASLERVRDVAMKMNNPADMLKICKAISLQLRKLGVEEIRNVQTAIFIPAWGLHEL